VVEDRAGRPLYTDDILEDSKESSEVEGSSQFVAVSNTSSGRRGAVKGKDAASSRDRFSITLRRVKISPEKKRQRISDASRS